MVEQGDLDEELAERARLNVVVVRARDAAHPRVRGAVVRNLEVESLKNDTLALEDLLARVAVLGHVDELLDARGHDLLVLGGDEHGRDADELELDQADDAPAEEAVDDVDGDPERLGQHVVAHVDLEQPVDEGGAHTPAATLKRLLQRPARHGTHHSISVWSSM